MMDRERAESPSPAGRKTLLLLQCKIWRSWFCNQERHHHVLSHCT
jgi:hypothetical protein